MSVSREIVLTPEGKERLSAELAYLKNVALAEALERLRRAREQSPGDVGPGSESAAVLEAQTEVERLEARIAELESTLARAKVVAAPSTGTIGIGSRVTVRDEEGEQTFTLVTAAEANVLAGRISVDSPVGRAVLGRRSGETVEVKTPAGVRRLTIVRVE
jgi:transcription elongation factor GreA